MPAFVSCEGVPEALVGAVERDAEALLVDRGGDAVLSVVLCDDAFIQPLNLQWRGKDQPTDVLSFPQDSPGPIEVLGDIVISVTTAQRQAKEQGHALHDEIRVLLVHGYCHLLGHDHLEDAEAARMRGEESRLLGQLGGGRSLVDRARAG